MRKMLSLLTCLFVFFSVVADEGMWLISLIEKLNYDQMKKMGLQLTPEQIYSINHSSLKDAVVIFNGGCTGEMVSPEGLLFTNHHCGFDAIQSHSNVGHDYLKDGFWAKSREEELPNPGMFVSFLIRIEDVTDRILYNLSDTLKESERRMHISAISSEIVRDAVAGNKYEAEVKPMFEGNAYYLFVYETYKDVRLVGAPPQCIGKFGGEVDNWMWPRHTGDFSIFRVYSSPDGNPAEYSKENIPLKPRHYLPISVKGVKPDDFTMVMGYPGTTDRYMTSYAVKELSEVVHPIRVNVRSARQALMMEDMKKDDKVRIQYASKYARSSNYWKFSIGQMRGIQKLHIIEKKQREEQQFAGWYASDSILKKEYQDLLPLLDRAITSRKDLFFSMQYITEAIFRSIEPVGLAIAFNPLYEELSKKEPEKKKIDEEIRHMIKSSSLFFKNYNISTDKHIAATMLKMMYVDMKGMFLPEYYSTIGKKYNGNIDKYVKDLYSKSIFCDSTRMKAFLADPNLKTLQHDMFFGFAQTSYSKYLSMQRENTMINAIIGSTKRKYLSGLQKMNPDLKFYPDANFTMRLTYGKVGGYGPADAVQYSYLTTLKGIMEKENPNNDEFHIPEKLKMLYKSNDYGAYGIDSLMPVCFITNNDITGGNSGSPVIDAKGQLVGIAFDGNWDAMTADILYDPLLQKCINVDIRYVLFIIDKFAGAGYLLNEMKITN